MLDTGADLPGGPGGAAGLQAQRAHELGIEAPAAAATSAAQRQLPFHANGFLLFHLKQCQPIWSSAQEPCHSDTATSPACVGPGYDSITGHPLVTSIESSPQDCLCMTAWGGTVSLQPLISQTACHAWALALCCAADCLCTQARSAREQRKGAYHVLVHALERQELQLWELVPCLTHSLQAAHDHAWHLHWIQQVL